jgi:enoyl-CoA hydratase
MAELHCEYGEGRGWALVTIDRPQALNAMNAALRDRLREMLAELAREPRLGAVILTGAGERAFTAGADIAEMAATDAGTVDRFVRDGQELMNAVEALPAPVIAAVNGYALGGGCELALACDLILASETAVFGLPEVDLGILPGWGGTQRLPRRVGAGRARELIFTGRRVTAAEALSIGLADAVFPPAQLVEEARALAGRLAAKSPAALRAAKSALRAAALRPDYDAERAAFVAAFATEERQAAMQAFLSRKK